MNEQTNSVGQTATTQQDDEISKIDQSRPWIFLPPSSVSIYPSMLGAPLVAAAGAAIEGSSMEALWDAFLFTLGGSGAAVMLIAILGCLLSIEEPKRISEACMLNIPAGLGGAIGGFLGASNLIGSVSPHRHNEPVSYITGSGAAIGAVVGMGLFMGIGYGLSSFGKSYRSNGLFGSRSNREEITPILNKEEKFEVDSPTVRTLT